jgi:putative transposase
VIDAELVSLITEIHTRSRCTYGAPRVHAELGRLGRRCGRKRVARLMRGQRLVGVHARRRWRRGRPDTASAPDLVRRDFNPAGPDRLWAADVTQFRTGEGWLHLAAVIDLWSRRVVGWAMDVTVNADLVTDALVMAFNRRRPDRRVVHHSDRGAVGEFNWLSQHLEMEVVCDGQQASAPAGDSCDARKDLVAGSAVDGAARGSSPVLGGDRAR